MAMSFGATPSEMFLMTLSDHESITTMEFEELSAA
jgi:hypothetical protein